MIQEYCEKLERGPIGPDRNLPEEIQHVLSHYWPSLEKFMTEVTVRLHFANSGLNEQLEFIQDAIECDLIKVD